MKKIIILTIFFTIALNGRGNKRDYIKIDWEKGEVIVSAIASLSLNESGLPVDTDTGNIISINKGRANAYETAKCIAIGKIVSVLKNIQVDERNRLIDIVKINQDSRRKLSGMVHKRFRYNNFPAGFGKSGCKATVKFRDIIDILPYKYPNLNLPVSDNIPISTYYSSLIVDVRGLGINPMVFPSIYNETGLEIYGRYFIDISYALKNGIVKYVYNENQAKNDKKAGSHPYFVAAIKNLNGNPVIPYGDIKRIYSHKNSLEKLKECKVIFIIDREK
jgi:hypothetical protein